MPRFLPIAAVALLAGSAVRAQTIDALPAPHGRAPTGIDVGTVTLPFSVRGDESLSVTSAYLGGDYLQGRDGCARTCGKLGDRAVLASAPEFHPASAIAALTLLLCAVAVLKGWRRD